MTGLLYHLQPTSEVNGLFQKMPPERYSQKPKDVWGQQVRSKRQKLEAVSLSEVQMGWVQPVGHLDLLTSYSVLYRQA